MCVQYKLCALRHAFNAKTLKSLIKVLLRNVVEQIDPQLERISPRLIATGEPRVRAGHLHEEDAEGAEELQPRHAEARVRHAAEEPRRPPHHRPACARVALSAVPPRAEPPTWRAVSGKSRVRLSATRIRAVL